MIFSHHLNALVFQYYTDQFDLMSREMDEERQTKDDIQRDKRQQLNKQKIHQVTRVTFHSVTRFI